MIFHTAAEEQYYRSFFKSWFTSIKTFNPEAKFNLRFIGKTDNCDVIKYCKDNDIILDLDPTSIDEVQMRYNCNAADARGYYAISRWISLPVNVDHVCMTDVDLMQLNQLDFNLSNKLDEKQFITFSRQKIKKTNKMMFLGFNKDFTSTVRDKSINILQNNNLTWDLDVSILTWLILHNNFNWEEFKELYCIDNLSISSRVKFGYFSPIDFVHNAVKYEHGVEAKAARCKLFGSKIES